MEWEKRICDLQLSRRQFFAGAVIAGLDLAFGSAFADGGGTNLLLPTYHRVSSSSILIGDYLRCRQNGWEAISFEDLGRFIVEDGELPEYCFLPTFDDGFVEQKLTILAAREYIKSQLGEEYKAVVFALTQYEHPDQPVESLPESTLTYREKDYYAPGEKPRQMTLGDTLELLQRGEGFIRMEDHTMDHVDLTKSSLSEWDRIPQIVEGKRRTDVLYQRAGMERIFSALAYPNWQHNEQVRKEVEQAGYIMAFGRMVDYRAKQKIMEPVFQTSNERFFLQRMSRT